MFLLFPRQAGQKLDDGFEENKIVDALAYLYVWVHTKEINTLNKEGGSEN